MLPLSSSTESMRAAPSRERLALVVEPDAEQRRRLAAQLQQRGYLVVAVASAEEALPLLGQHVFVLSIVALRLPGMSGLEMLRRAPEGAATGAVVIGAEAGQGAQLAEAIQAGAGDVIRRPYAPDDVEHALTALETRPGAADDTGARIEQELALLVSPPMREILGVIDQAARTEVTVLIRGETGVGKEVVARAIHGRSPRHRRPYVKVSCAAMPRELLESELFGHERGAFTGAHQRKAGRFELADGGTIFLDEIGELHPALQAKLLHVLQDGEFSRVGGEQNLRADVRVICATNRDLAREVGAQRFREDLYYRLNVIEIRVPPLRERREEIPGLAAHFVQRYAQRYNLPSREIPASTLRAMLDYPWPGNVRELENFVKRMIVLQDTMPPHPAAPVLPPPPLAAADPGAGTLSLKEISRRAVMEAEREVISRVLEQCRWNRVQAAKTLKISYRALLYKIKDMGLRRDSAAS